MQSSRWRVIRLPIIPVLSSVILNLTVGRVVMWLSRRMVDLWAWLFARLCACTGPSLSMWMRFTPMTVLACSIRALIKLSLWARCPWYLIGGSLNLIYVLFECISYLGWVLFTLSIWPYLVNHIRIRLSVFAGRSLWRASSVVYLGRWSLLLAWVARHLAGLIACILISVTAWDVGVLVVVMCFIAIRVLISLLVLNIWTSIEIRDGTWCLRWSSFYFVGC